MKLALSTGVILIALVPGAFTQKSNATCPQPQPAAQASNFTQIFDDPAIQNRSIGLLSGAVQVPTVSFDDMGPPDQDERWAPFNDFHRFLEDSFPTLYSTANVTTVNNFSLIFTLAGSNPDLKPTMITGHQDVVPASSALDRWPFPPFSGTVDDTWIYGRGSGDCKNTVIGSMIAVEQLLQGGWMPTRTLILAFGQDEELGGRMGAVLVNEHLLSLYGENGIAIIVDEGGSGVDDSLFGTTFALPGVVEKGSTSVEVRIDMEGGHASRPSEHTTIGILSEIVTALETTPNVFQPHLEESSPIWTYLECVAQFGNQSLLPPWINQDVNAETPNFQDAANNFANISTNNRYLVQTSKASTIFNAGTKTNQLAETATTIWNVRIDIFSTVADIERIFMGFINPVAEKYSLVVNGTSLSDKPTMGNVTVTFLNPHGATPISPFSSESTPWRVITEVNQAIFGADVITSPSAMTGNTDARNYLQLTRNIYRWSPVRVDQRLNIHTVDERISIKSYIQGLKFYTELIIRLDNLTSDEGF